MTYHHCGTLLWIGVCHFDTKPHFFPEAPCQNDIPHITYMIMWLTKNARLEDDLSSLWYPIMKRGMSFWHETPKFSRGPVSKWHTPHTTWPNSKKKKFRQNFWRKKIMKFQFRFFVKNFWRNFFFRVLAGWCGGYVILTRGPENFPEVRVKMTYPPSW